MQKQWMFFLGICLIGISCNKLANSPTPSYDESNRILRIKASSDNNVPYMISVSEINPASGAIDAHQEASQNLGTPFEYPFTPVVGDSVKVVIQSVSNPIYLYVLYKGALIKQVDISQSSTGKSYGIYEYYVEN